MPILRQSQGYSSLQPTSSTEPHRLVSHSNSKSASPISHNENNIPVPRKALLQSLKRKHSQTQNHACYNGSDAKSNSKSGLLETIDEEVDVAETSEKSKADLEFRHYDAQSSTSTEDVYTISPTSSTPLLSTQKDQQQSLIEGNTSWCPPADWQVQEKPHNQELSDDEKEPNYEDDSTDSEKTSLTLPHISDEDFRLDSERKNREEKTIVAKEKELKEKEASGSRTRSLGIADRRLWSRILCGKVGKPWKKKR